MMNRSLCGGYREHQEAFMARGKKIKNILTRSPSYFSNLLSISAFSSVAVSSSFKTQRNQRSCSSPILSLFFLSLLAFFTFFGFFVFNLIPVSQNSGTCLETFRTFSPSDSVSFIPMPDSLSPPPQLTIRSVSANDSAGQSDNGRHQRRLSSSAITASLLPLPAHQIPGNVSDDERTFWEQPNGEGYMPCLNFSHEYRKASARILSQKERYLVVIVTGGLNQQRYQIVDAVILARILEVSLVVPILEVNKIWGDESEFSDIFDVEHFKSTLKADVRIVSSLPATHILPRQNIEGQMPFHAPPIWFRREFATKLNNDGLLVLKAFESRLSKNLPPDLQRLKCKVAFHALKFVPYILELGDRLARRMWNKGPYVAVHFRLEKDVWIRSGCPTGLGPEYDEIISAERKARPDWLTDRRNITIAQRRLSGQCPLNAYEVARLSKALGAPNHTRIYIAGGEPFGGDKALQPLLEEFPNVVTKDTLAEDDELTPYVSKASVLAAIDYIVSVSSDVLLASHGGNMASALKGHRAYMGHRKFISPHKRSMLRLFQESSLTDKEFNTIMKKMHKKSQGQPVLWRKKRTDVLASPIPDCMCKP